VRLFTGVSSGHSESVFCSSVTKVTELMFLQTSHSPLTITTEIHVEFVQCWANPTVRGIQQLRKNSIQTIRDSADVLRHIIKNVSSRLVGTI